MEGGRKEGMKGGCMRRSRMGVRVWYRRGRSKRRSRWRRRQEEGASERAKAVHII